ncbi:MAG: GntR family transcriptional regulator [Micromonosporaceae bacterium]
MYRSASTSGNRAQPGLSRGAEAHARIREMILAGELAQGSVISEAELVRRLGMSRTPVREALRRLEAENYLWSVPGRGYAVTELSEHDLYDLYAVRAALEGLAAEHATERLTRIDIARLEDLYDAMAGAIGQGDDDELAKLNSQFHEAVAHASGNSYLQAMLSNIRDAFERFRMTALAQPGRRDEAHGEHGELIAALRARDPERARDIAVAHVNRALELRRGLRDRAGEAAGGGAGRAGGGTAGRAAGGADRPSREAP